MIKKEIDNIQQRHGKKAIKSHRKTAMLDRFINKPDKSELVERLKKAARKNDTRSKSKT